METVVFASRFIDLVLRFKPSEGIDLSPEDILTLLKIVEVAGFKPKSLILGKLKGNYLDQDGSATGETYPINSICPLKVVDEKNEDNYFATGWLDCAWR